MAPAMVAGNGADQDIAVVDVSELVRKNALEFFIVQYLQDSLRDRDRSVARIASRGERVRGVRWNHVHLRHRNADFLREALNGLVSARKLLARDWLCAIHGKSNLVGEKIRNEVHDNGEGQCQEHSVLTAERATDEHQQQRKGGQEESSLESVSHRFVALSYWMFSGRARCIGAFLEKSAFVGYPPSPSV